MPTKPTSSSSSSSFSSTYLPPILALTTGILLGSLLSHLSSTSSRNIPQPLPIPSPLRKILSTLSKDELEALPYPPDMFPGARDVETPMGSIRVYEWGPEEGKKVLFVHGISTPAMSLGGLAEEVVARGGRVMLFDLFGRGYSDTPSDLAHDARLFITQILLVISSSPISWTGSPGFNLVGYSLGGGVCISFTRYLPHLVQSLTLIAPGGLIRPSHIAWKSKILYSRGIIPEFLLERLVKRRLQPQTQNSAPSPTATTAADPDEAVSAELSSHTSENQQQQQQQQSQARNSDATGGDSYDNAILSKRYPHISVASAVSWQITHHPGFIPAFMSSIRYAPIYNQAAVWRIIGARLNSQRQRQRQRLAAASAASVPPNPQDNNREAATRQRQRQRQEDLHGNRILLVLGTTDPVVVAEEIVVDAKAAVLGEENLEIVMVQAGHELPITKSAEVAEAMWRFWGETEMETE